MLRGMQHIQGLVELWFRWKRAKPQGASILGWRVPYPNMLRLSAWFAAIHRPAYPAVEF